MNTEKKVEFRDAFRGYHKQSVNDYITALAEEYAKRKEEWETETTRLREALAAADEEKNTLSEKYKKLTKDHDVLTVEKKKNDAELAKATEEAKSKKDADTVGEATRAALKEELEKATVELVAGKDALAKQKKANDSLAAELTTLKNKLADKNGEVDALKKALTAAEKTSEDRLSALSKQSGTVEGLEAQIALLKKALEEKENNPALDTDAFFKKLDERLIVLSEKSAEKEAEKKTEEAPLKEKNVSEVDKKIDSFFGDM